MTVYAIAKKEGSHWSIVTGLGGSRCLQEDFTVSIEHKFDIYETFFPAYDVLVWLSVILTRHQDTNWASHELNKLYSSLTEYRYFICEDTDKIDFSEGRIDLKEYEVSEMYFTYKVFSSDIAKVVKEAYTLCERKERFPVQLDICFEGDTWSFISDHYPRKDTDMSIEIPLDITIENARDYISELTGKTYKVQENTQ